jgi:hypothetical protein
MTNTTSPPILNSSSPTVSLSPFRNLTEEFKKATRIIRNRLGNANDLSQEIFFLGDGIQRAAVDRLFELLQPCTWSPAGLARMSSNTLSEGLQVARFFAPGQTSYLSWLELENKLEVFLLVQNLPSILGLSAVKPAPLPELVQKAYSLSPFAALWGVEGLGHYYTDTYWDLNGQPEGLLSPSRAAVPEKSLLMLHAGMGLAFAYRLLSGLMPQSPPAQVRETVGRFITLCRANSREGCLGAAIESLGLVTRDFYPEMVRGISQSLAEADPHLSGSFWHGVGRALYFSRAYFLPMLRTPWSAVDREGSTNPQRLNLMSGLAWAVTLVNMRHPRVMENILNTYVQQSGLEEAFADGVSSSILMRSDTTPGAPFISQFCSYQPVAEKGDAKELWNRLVTAPCERALRSCPRLKEGRLRDQIFSYGASLW